MRLRDSSVPGVTVVETKSHVDGRGAFTRLFCGQEMHNVLQDRRILQINHSRTLRLGAVRGLHFQQGKAAEMKMVRCLRGRVWDVAVDIRAGSRTFLQWHAEELSENGQKMIVLPEGFAHGFQVLEPESELLYLHTAYYDPQFESGLRYDDPRLGIEWPLTPTDLSSRDLTHELVDEEFLGVVV